MKTDIEIAREAHLEPIQTIADNIGINANDVIPYGHHIAKTPLSLIDEEKVKNSNLILVTAITPTKSGNGKTMTSVGLSLGLNQVGKKAIVALREPSLGPCFGMKGGAAGGGYSQVLPMENINLHFTGDFHAITSANNTISAMIDNYQFQNRKTGKALKEVVWKRVQDVNDRNLRSMISGVGGNANGVTSETGFDITPASEIMAILCLANDLEDLRTRLENITLGYDFDNNPFTLKDLGIAGAIVVLLKDALNPNLVQTTENTPAFIHGGPFANIAHGCNSVLATKMALSYGEYVVTEAGFGADLGAEKFLDIKCRNAGIAPKATVLVATTQALKYHGGVPQDAIKEANEKGLRNGFANLDRHIKNLQSFGQSVVVAINKFHTDSDEEIQMIKDHCAAQGAACEILEAFVHGGKGAVDLANAVVNAVENNPSSEINYAYDLEDSIEDKLSKIAKNIYGADGIELTGKAKTALKRIKRLGLENYPVCIAKTQYSFSDDANALGKMEDFKITFDDLIINTGAGFIVAKSGAIMRMPGLPKVPQALHIDFVDGKIEGLS
ncbi:formate--tetrahydrofolate ligase [Aureibacter tunicatorum]|uniref:Formate--tetrahydrofolate ligase n=1 Tax=Aureibacter tunicatorum TaxID=866807 RepID=A0AAE3XLX8_9BACT|nr:formate--tetrahydrofolate ligase [Aureibacter tunicatorum]MDR6239013.1 formate--tetrahydrofolate ligase [Aureibacter tunicatorum]BDD05061.1 formate--tetrahydrofolate ligase [Aureibacter tunicatorum]